MARKIDIRGWKQVEDTDTGTMYFKKLRSGLWYEIFPSRSQAQRQTSSRWHWRRVVSGEITASGSYASRRSARRAVIAMVMKEAAWTGRP